METDSEKQTLDRAQIILKKKERKEYKSQKQQNTPQENPQKQLTLAHKNSESLPSVREPAWDELIPSALIIQLGS